MYSSEFIRECFFDISQDFEHEGRACVNMRTYMIPSLRFSHFWFDIASLIFKTFFRAVNFRYLFIIRTFVFGGIIPHPNF